MKKILTMSVREIYAVLLISAMLLFALIYTSFALFEKSVERVGIASIVASEINFSLTSDESAFIINGNSGTITVASGEAKSFNITISNNLANTTKYKMYYKFFGDVIILGVDVGISSISESPTSDLINSGNSKTVKVIVKNESSQQVTIEIGVQGGYASNVVLLNTGRNEMNIIEETLSYSTYTDTSGANSPKLAEGMIPVIYNDTDDVWEVADTSTEWYNYDTKMWANAVTVTNINRSMYLNAEPGTEISMEDINSMWVWIPRYKYMIPSNIGSSSNVTNPPQIDVIFENGTETTGATETVYRTNIASDGTYTNYYTHPAFRNINNIEYDSTTTSRGAWDKEITGFWVGKFETGTSNEECNLSTEFGLCEDVDPIIKPDVISLTNQNISTQFKTSLKFAGGIMDNTTGDVTFVADLNNAYGLNTTSNTIDTHMTKNTEWGAVAILSQSQYGKMGNDDYIDTNKEVYRNNSSKVYTGRSEGSTTKNSTLFGSYSYNDKTCFDVVCTGEETINEGRGSSTTGTIYGVYDMNSGGYEHVMGNWSGNVSLSGFNVYPNSKYYDFYNGIESDNVTLANSILGDATWETNYWYADTGSFIEANTYSWMTRSGNNSDGSDYFGIFSFDRSDGKNTYREWTFRTTLIK